LEAVPPRTTFSFMPRESVWNEGRFPRDRVRTVASWLAAAAVSTTSWGSCPADLDGDGLVSGPDLALLLGNWTGSGTGDLNGDGLVGGGDLAALLAAWGPCPASGPIETELAARPLDGHPFASPTVAFRPGTLHVAIDPVRFPALAGATVPVFLVADRTAAQWEADASLVDARGASESVTFGETLETCVRPLSTAGLPVPSGAAFSRGFDLVLDVDADGQLSAADFVDGRGDDAGFRMVVDGSLPGPYAVSTVSDWDTNIPQLPGPYQFQRIFYPTSIAQLGPRPLVAIGHGNGFGYDWYDWLGQHLASWGFVAMQHSDYSGPGIETSALSVITHTDAILGAPASLAGGALAGRIDASRIVWVGHSRSGEGTVRAYDRIRNDLSTPVRFNADSIRLLVGLAPTDFLGPAASTPHEVPYVLVYGSADGDVCGCPGFEEVGGFHLFERARGDRAALYLHGADHDDFSFWGFNDFTGPEESEIGRETTQSIARLQVLAAIRHVLDADPAARELLWRPFGELRPGGVEASIVATREFRSGSGGSVVEDAQVGTGVAVSSSGGSVVATGASLLEGRLDDGDASFAWTASDPWNGMIRGRPEDDSRALAVEWNGSGSVEFGLVPALRDLSAQGFLSLRAARVTRHPLTAPVAQPLVFSVAIVDGGGRSSELSIAPYRMTLPVPYARDGYGVGLGWQDEFVTVRLPLEDFRAGGRELDLSDIVAIRIGLGGEGGPAGRIAIDDLRLDPR
jgi:hypothetical protein